MNKKEKINNLLKDIQDLYAIANRLEHEEQIHPLDIDLALSKVRNLYDLLLTIHPQTAYKFEYQNKKTEKKSLPEEKNEPISTIEKEKPEPTEKTKEEKREFVIEEPSKSIEKFKEEKSSIEEESSNSLKKKEKQQEGSPIVADKFQSKKFIHDNMAQKKPKKDVSTKMQSKPIQDIASAISLNDKFIFIRELFKGDKEQYLETIQILNNFDTYENALKFLNENFDWEAEDPNFERLKELVKRKFAAN
ncbi:MAG: hypothetical protein SVU94_07550 [Bacteroidota bacterium]|nr:hypothetical protein [Bacteroidota bacterium]